MPFYRVPRALWTLRSVGAPEVQSGPIVLSGGVFLATEIDTPADLEGGGQLFWTQVRDRDPVTGDRIVFVDGDPPPGWTGLLALTDVAAGALVDTWGAARGSQTPLMIEARRARRIVAGRASADEKREHFGRGRKQRDEKRKGRELSPAEEAAHEAALLNPAQIAHDELALRLKDLIGSTSRQGRPNSDEVWAAWKVRTSKSYQGLADATLRTVASWEAGASTMQLSAWPARINPDPSAFVMGDIGPLPFDDLMDDLAGDTIATILQNLRG